MSTSRTDLRRFGTDLTFAVALTVVAVYAFESSFGTLEFMVVGALGIALGALVVGVGEWRRIDMLYLAVVLFVGHVIIGGTVAFRDEATAGFLPSVSTMRAALDGTVLAWKRLLTTVPPVGGMGELLVVPFFCGAFSVALSFLAARRLRSQVAAVIPPSAVMALGIICGVDQPVSVVLHGAVMGGLILCWLSIRHRRMLPVVAMAQRDQRRRTAAAVVLIGAVAVAGFVGGPRLPLVQANDRYLLRENIDPPFDPFEYPSPLAEYRDFVKTRKDNVLFTVEGLPEGVPIRLATMDSYDGLVWRVTSGEGVRSGASGYFERVGVDIPPEFDGERRTIRVTIGEFPWSDVWIPTVGEVVSIRFEGPRATDLERAFRYARGTDTGAQQQRILQPGDTYVMEVVLPRQLDDLDDPQIVSDAANSSNLLVPEELITFAAPITRSEPAAIDKTTTLAASMRDDGVFSDGAEGQEKVEGGHAAYRLSDFVTAEYLVGNAEQYAASFGLMLRGIGIPSRVVAGFIPEEWDEQGTIEIAGGHAEAWVEVPVAGAGWVTVLSTPDEEQTAPKEDPAPKPIPERNTQVPPPPPALVDDPRTDPPEENENNKDIEAPELPEQGEGLSVLTIVVAVVVALPVLAVLMLSVGVLALKSRRRRRRERRGTVSERAANGFAEVVDAAVDLGKPMPPNLTRRELAQFVAAPSCSQVARGADTLVFGPGDGDERSVEALWNEVDAVLGELRAEAGLFAWLKARFSLSSLRGRR
jgi:transglutaminase-like putative cysteine protease